VTTAQTPAPYDAFLSHSSKDKDWVRTLRDGLEQLGLRVYLDEKELEPGRNFVLSLDGGLARSRFLVLILSDHTVGRDWVAWEYTTFMANRGPLGRIIPVRIDPVELPHALLTAQAIHALDRDAGRVARALFDRVGRPEQLPPGDLRRLSLGQHLAFALERHDTHLSVRGQDGQERHADDPRGSGEFDQALRSFRRLVRTPVAEDERADLVRAATAVGRALFDVLFDEPGRERLRLALAPGDRPLLTLLGEDDEVLAWPWELLHDGADFLVRDGRLDLVRSTPDQVAAATLLREPDGPFRLVVNVSAPAGSALNYERESYRITLALTEHCPLTPTELGTADDLAATLRREQPAGVHFSGHGGPATLVFEDDDGAARPAAVTDLVARLRRELPDGRLPPFFYLACCHGNDVGDGAESAAARLHRAGVTQVVGYSGPILDDLSTAAEEALYAALAGGRTTRLAVRDARNALLRPHPDAGGPHRDGGAAAGGGLYPFAWSQLVLYHRGPDFPLGTPTTAAQRRQIEATLRRTFEGLGRRRVLKTGFIGRRRELHRVRRHLLREGKRVLVLQGLGGLGKSTLAFHIPPLLGIPLTPRPSPQGGSTGSPVPDVCVLWCEGAEREHDPVEALVGQLLDYCGKRFGPAWEDVVLQVERAAGDDPVRRFEAFLQALLANVPRLVLLLDNLESLLVGPAEAAGERPDDRAFGAWRGEGLRDLWRLLCEVAEGGDRLWLIASCRYQNDDFPAVEPVTPLPADALFRLTGWFETLQRLAAATRARLVARLDGHPRAVEYAEDLVKHQWMRRRRTHGEWRLPPAPSADDLEREWAELVEPVLPQVRDKLWANLLLEAIWDHVLDDRMRRMLFRMTLLRRPWDWGLVAHLGDAGEDAATAEHTGEELCRTSLLETADVGGGRRYTLHPATAAYIRSRYSDDERLRRETHRRVGDYLGERAKTSEGIETDLEAGHHLFEAGEYDRACELLVSASNWLQNHGRVREGLRILEPFLPDGVREQMQQPLVGRLLGTVGLAYAALGQPQRAIEYYEQRLAIAREVGDRQGEGTALNGLGLAYAALGQPQRALDCYQQRLAIAREIGDLAGEGRANWNLGLVYEQQGDLAAAIRCMEVNVRFLQEICHPNAANRAAHVEQLRQRLADV
jgi:tetratricopeptide (TPR) repeat protein